MTPRIKFILKELFWSIAVLLGFVLMFGIITYYFDGEFSIEGFPTIFTIVMCAEIIGFIYNLYRLRKMGIDISLVENQNGTLNKTIIVELPKEKVLNMLKQNVWKFKTENKTETTEGTLLEMKHYRLFWNEKMEILVTETGSETCVVKLTAGYKERPFLFRSVHSAWPGSIQHIKYFEKELTKREELHLELA